MRESTMRLRSQHYQRHKVISKLRVKLRSSIVILTPNPSRTDFPRMIIYENPDGTEDAEELLDRHYQIEEILPSTDTNPIWNTGNPYKFDKPSRLFLSPEELAEALLPSQSAYELHEAPSPFDNLSFFPGYPENLPDFRYGIPPLQMEEGLDNADAQPGPSNGPPRPPKRKPNPAFMAIPVPSRRSSGIFHKFVYTKLPQEETDKYLEKQRLNFAAKTIEAKEIYEAFRDQAVIKGNRYYREWEDRERARQEEVWTEYKWDMAVQKYFVELKKFDEGIIKTRPQPLILVNDSVTALLRKSTDTPPDKILLSYYDDDDPGSPPTLNELPPFVHQENRDFLLKQRNARPPQMVPGGYLYVYYDVRENGEVFRVEEYEYAARGGGKCPMTDSSFLANKRTPKCFLSAPVLNTPVTMSLPPPVPDLNEVLIHRGWSKATIAAFRLQKDVTDKLIPITEDKADYTVFCNEIDDADDDNVPKVLNFRTGKEARILNPCVDYTQRVDWFLFFDKVLRNHKWQILKDRGLAPTQANFGTIDYRFKDMIQDRFLQGQTSLGSLQEELPLPGLNKGKVKIALCQMLSKDDKESNLQLGVQLLKYATAKNVAMVFFPESFDFIAETIEDTVEMSETLDGPIITRYKELARQFNIWISLGGFHEKLVDTIKGNGDPWLSHTHIILDPEGNIVSLYRKIHLKDDHKVLEELPPPSESSIKQETNYFKPGQEIVVTPDTPVGPVGLGIGHDLHFPEFGTLLRKKGTGILTYPSALSLKEGKIHWDISIKMRAIENQCFVICAAQSGQHNDGRFSYGHSIIVDPWGKVVVEMGQGSGIITAEIDLELLGKARAKT